jgi:hypothetical protein
MADEEILISSIIEHKSKNADDVLADAAKIDAELEKLRRGADIGVDLSLTDKSVLNSINALDAAKLTPVIDVSLPDDSVLNRLNALDTAKLTPTIDPSMPDDQPVQRVENLDSATVTPQVDASETASSKEVTSRLDALTKLQVIELAVNLTGTAQAFFDKFGRIGGFTGLIEMDSALSKIQARTGAMIPNAGKLIHDLYRDGWGESRGAIADVITQADNLGISQGNLQSAVQNALILQEVYGADTNDTLTTLDSLVKNNLAPDFDAAANLLVAGIQEGANKGGDLNDVIREFSPTFDRLKISGPGAMALLNSGMAVGFDNTSRVAEGIKQIGLNLANIKTDPNIAAAFRSLDNLSDIDLAQSLKDFNAGKITGDQFYNDFFTAIGDAAAANPARAQELANTLIGTQGEDFGVNLWGGVSTEWDTQMGTVEGRATTAGTAIKDNIGAQLDLLWKSVETAAGDFLSSDQIGLDAKIAEIKDRITEAINVLQSGGTLGEALEVGFQIKGVDEFLGNFQRIVGNLVIAILEFISGLQSGEAKQQTQATIANLAEGQLAFDLKLANEDELTGLVQTALNRGVEAADISSAVRTAGTELIAEGDLARARELLSTAQEISGTVQLAPGADPWGLEIIGNGVYTLAQAVKDYKEGTLELEQIQPLIDQGKLVNLEIDTVSLEEQADLAAEVMREKFETALAEGDVQTAFDIADQLDDTELMRRATLLAAQMATTKQDVATASNDMAASVEDADFRINNATVGNTMTKDFEAVRLSAQQNLPPVGSEFDDMAVISVKAMSRVKSWSEILQDSLLGFGDVLPILQGIATSVANIATAATNATNAVQGGVDLATGKQQPQAFAEGGVFMAGERGRELIFSDEDVAILNNRTTEAFLAGQRSMFAPLFSAQASNVVNNSERNVTLQQVFYVQSQAQAASAAQQTANSLRGY